MASWSCLGFVEAIKPLPQSCLLIVSEYKSGFRKQNGEYEDDKYLYWNIVFPYYFKKYLVDNFSKGMLVEVKAEALPYLVEHGTIKDGYSLVGQCCNRASYPRQTAKMEKKMMRESQDAIEDTPDLETYNQPDF